MYPKGHKRRSVCSIGGRPSQGSFYSPQVFLDLTRTFRTSKSATILL